MTIRSSSTASTYASRLAAVLLAASLCWLATWICGCAETGRDETGRDETGRDETGRDEMGRDEPEPATEAGLLVEAVGPDSAGARAGLEAGDVLLTWRRAEGEKKPLRHGFDLRYLEYEQAARGPIVLEVARAEQRFETSLSAESWRLEARPRLAGEARRLYDLARQRRAAGEVEPAVDLLRRAAATAAARGEPGRRLATFLEERAGDAALGGRRWSLAEECFERAIDAIRGVDAGWESALYMARSRGLLLAGDMSGAKAAIDRAIEGLSGERDLPLLLAQAVQRRAELHFRSGRFDSSEADGERALAIRRREVPGGLWHGRSLGFLGSIRLEEERFAEARLFFREALEIERTFDPESISAGSYYSNLALVEMREGDFAQAEALLLRYRDILNRRRGTTLARSSVSYNLAILRTAMGDLEKAESLLLESLALKQEVSEATPQIASSLGSLAEIQRLRGELDEAEKTVRHAYALMQRTASEAVLLAPLLGTLGNIARDRRDFAAAADHYDRALEILQREDPGSLREAAVLHGQADLAFEEDDLEEAEALGRRALEIIEWIAPGSEEAVKARRLLGRVLARRDRLEEATATYHRVLDELDRLARMQGRSDLRQIYFWRRAATYYHEALELEVAAGRPGRAYDILERSRARALVRLLAERGFDDVPAELRREIAELSARHEATRTRLAELSTDHDAAEVRALRSELRHLALAREQLWERAAASRHHPDPRRAAPPLEHGEVRSRLEPGTLILAYSVGRESSMLLALSKDEGPRAFPLSLGAEVLSAAVEALARDLLDGRRTTGAGGLRLRRAQRRARELYASLVAPAESMLEAATRVILLPDGALHDLPFAALVTSPQGAEVHYLAERVPLSSALSASQLAALRARLHADDRRRLAAFADPAYTRTESESDLAPKLRSLRDRAALRPLPGTRREARAIAGLFAESRLFLGEQASEEALRGLDDVDYLHFACHGFADPESPLDSSIALASVPRRTETSGNGLLHAWEIIQDLKLEAHLVVLSACSTASGRAMGGEGVVGLVRAFQAAGARSVVASLWTVEDDRAPELMIELYRRLRSGQPKDEALRQAQLSLLRPASGAPAPPYFWAGFQLFGDHR